MVPDPYKALELTHDATSAEIKNSYRKLALRYHPDRLVARNASEEEKNYAAERFAAIAAAYQLLSDEKRKRDYDHIYKFGGYDEEDPQAKQQQDPAYSRASAQTDSYSAASPRSGTRSTGIGYSVSDPLSYLFPKSSKSGHQAVAGIQIPSRIHLVNPPLGGGLRIAFSSGQFTTSKSGARKFVSKTTQFVQGKKFSRVETTTIHPDGRKEIIIEGDDYVQRRTTPPKNKRSFPSQDDVTSVKQQPEGPDEPWYVNAWNGIRDKFNMCLNPATEEFMRQ
jgi:curved DNA-binding protein CbpA